MLKDKLMLILILAVFCSLQIVAAADDFLSLHSLLEQAGSDGIYDSVLKPAIQRQIEATERNAKWTKPAALDWLLPASPHAFCSRAVDSFWVENGIVSALAGGNKPNATAMRRLVAVVARRVEETLFSVTSRVFLETKKSEQQEEEGETSSRLVLTGAVAHVAQLYCSGLRMSKHDKSSTATQLAMLVRRFLALVEEHEIADAGTTNAAAFEQLVSAVEHQQENKGSVFAAYRHPFDAHAKSATPASAWQRLGPFLASKTEYEGDVFQSRVATHLKGDGGVKSTGGSDNDVFLGLEECVKNLHALPIACHVRAHDVFKDWALHMSLLAEEDSAPPSSTSGKTFRSFIAQVDKALFSYASETQPQGRIESWSPLTSKDGKAVSFSVAKETTKKKKNKKNAAAGTSYGSTTLAPVQLLVDHQQQLSPLINHVGSMAIMEFVEWTTAQFVLQSKATVIVQATSLHSLWYSVLPLPSTSKQQQHARRPPRGSSSLLLFPLAADQYNRGYYSSFSVDGPSLVRLFVKLRGVSAAAASLNVEILHAPAKEMDAGGDVPEAAAWFHVNAPPFLPDVVSGDLFGVAATPSHAKRNDVEIQHGAWLLFPVHYAGLIPTTTSASATSAFSSLVVDSIEVVSTKPDGQSLCMDNCSPSDTSATGNKETESERNNFAQACTRRLTAEGLTNSTHHSSPFYDHDYATYVKNFCLTNWNHFSSSVSPSTSDRIVRQGQTLGVRVFLMRKGPLHCTKRGDKHVLDVRYKIKARAVVDASEDSDARATKLEHTGTLSLRCRDAATQTFQFTLLDRDGSVAHAAARYPRPTTGSLASTTSSQFPLLMPTVLSFHGTGVTPGSQADSYKVGATAKQKQQKQSDGDYVFGVEGAFVVAVDRHGAHNWESVGKYAGLSALFHAYITTSLRGGEQVADKGRVIFMGHSMGGHGALLAATHSPDRAIGGAFLAPWISKETYGDANLLFRFDRQTSFLDGQTKGELEATIAESAADLHLPNIVDVPDIFIRVGGNDRTVSPVYARRLHRLLTELGHGGAVYDEVAGKEHWWWDTRVANDGGTMNDATVRSALARMLKRDRRSVDGAATQNPTLLTWSFATVSPRAVAGKRGIAVLDQRHPLKLSTLHVEWRPRAEGSDQQSECSGVATETSSECRGQLEGGGHALIVTVRNVKRLAFYAHGWLRQILERATVARAVVVTLVSQDDRQRSKSTFEIKKSKKQNEEGATPSSFVVTSASASGQKELTLDDYVGFVPVLEYSEDRKRWEFPPDAELHNAQPAAFRAYTEQPFCVGVGGTRNTNDVHQRLLVQMAVYLSNLNLVAYDTTAPVLAVSSSLRDARTACGGGGVMRLRLSGAQNVSREEKSVATAHLQSSPTSHSFLDAVLSASSAAALQHLVFDVAQPTVPPMMRCPFGNTIPASFASDALRSYTGHASFRNISHQVQVVRGE